MGKWWSCAAWSIQAQVVVKEKITSKKKKEKKKLFY
jgi:hypothetical protein